MVETSTPSQVSTGRPLYKASNNTQRMNSRRCRSKSRSSIFFLQYPVLNSQAELIDLGFDHRLPAHVVLAPHVPVWQVDEQIAQLAVDLRVVVIDTCQARLPEPAALGAGGLLRREPLIQARLELRDDFAHQPAERLEHRPAAGGQRR